MKVRTTGSEIGESEKEKKNLRMMTKRVLLT